MYSETKLIWMIGPDLFVNGGITKLTQIYLREHNMLSPFRVKFIPSYSDQTRFARLIWFLRCFISIQSMLLGSCKPSIVHIHFATRGSMLRKGLLMQYFSYLGIHVVAHAHGGRFREFYEHSIFRNQISNSLNCCDQIIVLGKEWQKFYQEITSVKKLPVLRHPIDMPKLNNYSRPQLEQRVLVVGRLGQNKGTTDILNSLLVLRERYPNLRIAFAGHGELDATRKTAVALDIYDKIDICGWVTQDELEGLYRSANIFLLPSYAEGLPNAVLEAMAHGLPVITTPVGDIPDVITHGETGYLVEPGDIEGIAAAIEYVINNPEEAEQVGLNARELVERECSVEVVMAKLIEIYEGTLVHNARQASFAKDC